MRERAEGGPPAAASRAASSASRARAPARSASAASTNSTTRRRAWNSVRCPRRPAAPRLPAAAPSRTSHACAAEPRGGPLTVRAAPLDRPHRLARALASRRAGTPSTAGRERSSAEPPYTPPRTGGPTETGGPARPGGPAGGPICSEPTPQSAILPLRLRVLEPIGRRSTACHAEGRGFDSLHPLSLEALHVAGFARALSLDRPATRLGVRAGAGVRSLQAVADQPGTHFPTELPPVAGSRGKGSGSLHRLARPRMVARSRRLQCRSYPETLAQAVARDAIEEFVVIVLAAPGGAGPSRRMTRAAPSKEIVDAMVEQFGLTPKEARERIRAEGKASDIREAAKQAAGEAFAGAYFDRPRAVLVVAVDRFRRVRCRARDRRAAQARVRELRGARAGPARARFAHRHRSRRRSSAGASTRRPTASWSTSRAGRRRP